MDKRTTLQHPGTILALSVLAAVGWALSSTAPVYADVTNPIGNYCPNSVATIANVKTDNAAGVTWSSSVFAPLTGGNVGIYFKNNGPGPIDFDAPSWSVRGSSIPTARATIVPLTPGRSQATFNDLGWSGPFGDGVDILGCTAFSSVSFARPRQKQATAHLDLSFFRGSTRYTVRVNVHLGRLPLERADDEGDDDLDEEDADR